MAVRYRVPDALRPGIRGKRFGIVNDVTSAGSAVRGTLVDLEEAGAEVVAIGSLLALGPAIADFTRSRAIPFETLASIDHQVWEPSDCPLCAAGVPLTVPSYGPAIRP
jgi:orotate phosphoribosyltransferase